MAIFALYYALKVDNIWLVPIMFIVSVPILIFLGWVSLFHMDKVMEYLQIQFATHWSRYNMELQEDQRDTLKRIEEMITDELNPRGKDSD
jgi:hypothetical protein